MIRNFRVEVEMKLSQRPQVQHLLLHVIIIIIELLKLILILVGTISFIQSHINRRIEKKSS